MKINGEKYVDETQLTEELEKLKTGSINQIQLVRSVKENTYMQVDAHADSYDLCFVKGDDTNYISLDKQDFGNIADALLSYCNKDGRYKKMFRWEKANDTSVDDSESEEAADEPVEDESSEEPAKRLTPFECFTTTLTKNYCNFSGRASRRTYWFYVLFVFLFIVLILVGTLVAGASPESVPVVYIIISLALALPGLSLMVRRLHDADKSGWYVLLVFLPYIGGLIALYFALQAGTPGKNKYGLPEN